MLILSSCGSRNDLETVFLGSVHPVLTIARPASQMWWHQFESVPWNNELLMYGEMKRAISLETPLMCLDRCRTLRTTQRYRFYLRKSDVTECKKEHNRVESKSFCSLKLTLPVRARASEGAFGEPLSNETEPRCISIFRLHTGEERGFGDVFCLLVCTSY